LLRLRHVDFIARHNLGCFGQLRVELLQLPVDGVKILDRVSSLVTAYIHQVHQQPAALHMAQKVMTQAHAV